MSQDITIASRWDEQYKHGRYANESPIEFVSEILDSLKTNGLDRELGLYLGCGNGRNYIPLRDKNLNILGIDISQSAISALVDLRPKYAQDLQCTSITGFEANHKFAYIIAIQILQHGDSKTITFYFDKINELLENNGMISPTQRQIKYLKALGYTGDIPLSIESASKLIQDLKSKKKQS